MDLSQLWIINVRTQRKSNININKSSKNEILHLVFECSPLLVGICFISLSQDDVQFLWTENNRWLIKNGCCCAAENALPHDGIRQCLPIQTKCEEPVRFNVGAGRYFFFFSFKNKRRRCWIMIFKWGGKENKSQKRVAVVIGVAKILGTANRLANKKQNSNKRNLAFVSSYRSLLFFFCFRVLLHRLCRKPHSRDVIIHP